MVLANWWGAPIPMPSLACGLRADLYDAVTPGQIIIEGGTFSWANGHGVVSFADTIFIDPAIHGVNGRDQAAPFVDGDHVCVYLIGNPATKEVAGLLSKGYDYGNVSWPSGWFIRKHPLALAWRDVWGGFPAFHFAGIQNPKTMFGYFDTVPQFQVSFAGNSTTPAGIDLRPLVPAFSGPRYVHLSWALYGQVPVSAYLGWGPGVMREMVTVPADGSGSKRGETEMRCTSDGSMAYRVSDSRATFVLWVRGYTNTEVTT